MTAFAPERDPLRNASAIKPVIEPPHDGAWVLKARKVRSRPSGPPEQQAFYARADGTGWFWIRTVSAGDASPSIEDDKVRAHREVGNFYLFQLQHDRRMRLSSRWRLPLSRRLPPPKGKPDLPNITSNWSAARITVDGTRIDARTARVGDQGWIGWWAHEGVIVEVQSDTTSINDANLISTS